MNYDDSDPESPLKAWISSDSIQLIIATFNHDMNFDDWLEIDTQGSKSDFGIRFYISGQGTLKQSPLWEEHNNDRLIMLSNFSHL